MTTSERWRIALWLSALAFTLYVLFHARAAILPFAVGAVLAYALSPIVDHVATLIPTKTHRGDVYRRGLVVLLIYIAIALVLFVAASLILPRLVDQVGDFVETLPETAEAARLQANDWFELYRDQVPEDVQERIDESMGEITNAATDATVAIGERTIGLITGTIGIVVGFVVMPLFMFYAMRDRHYVRRNVVNAIPERLQADAGNLIDIGDRVVGRYIQAQLFLGLVVGTAVTVSLTLLDIEMSLALGLFAGLTELIPIIGPWIGAVPALVIVAATQPDKILWVALAYLVVQQVENVFLVPRIQGRAVEVHPAMILVLLAVAGATFGLIGLVVIVPAAGLAREIFWYLDHRLRGEPPAVALAASHVGRSTPVGVENEDGLAVPPGHGATDEGLVEHAKDGAIASEDGSKPSARGSGTPD